MNTPTEVIQPAKKNSVKFLKLLKSSLAIVLIIKYIAISTFIVYNMRGQDGLIKSLSKWPSPRKPNGILYSDMFPTIVQKERVSIVVIVLSALEKYERRRLIRETWWKDCRRLKKVTCVFMTDSLEEIHNSTKIRKEIHKHNDIITSPVRKGLFFGHRILFALQWAMTYYDFDYILRSDDDVMICMENMMNRITSLPRKYFMSGILHCSGEGLVYLDEGFVTFSKDIVVKFLSQGPNEMLCHKYGDQTYTTWIQDLNLNQTKLYHIETRVHHHPPASRTIQFEDMTNICNKYIALHGVYGRDMAKFWNRRGFSNYSYDTGLESISKLCGVQPKYDWRKFEGIYGFEPVLCNNHEKWKDVVGQAFQSREHK